MSRLFWFCRIIPLKNNILKWKNQISARRAIIVPPHNNCPGGLAIPGGRGYLCGAGTIRRAKDMAEKIKNLVFDMGGVLIDLDRSRCVAAFTAIGFPQAGDMLSNYAGLGALGELEAGQITPAEFFDRVRLESGLPLTDAQITAALNEFLTGLPAYKLQMLLDLRKRFKVYLLSNTNAVMMPHIRATYFTQQGLTFDDYFDRAFLSYEMGSIKPGEEIFCRMMAEGGIRPEESLFIDDGPANIETAARLGFGTYLAKDGEDFRHIFDGL